MLDLLKVLTCYARVGGLRIWLLITAAADLTDLEVQLGLTEAKDTWSEHQIHLE